MKKNRMTSMRDLRLSLTDKYSIPSFYTECVNEIWIWCEGYEKKTAYRPNRSLAVKRETPCFPGEGNRAFSLMQMKRV